jgi:hypothetical protein
MRANRSSEKTNDISLTFCTARPLECIWRTFMLELLTPLASASAIGAGKKIAPALEKRIREALATPGRPGMRVIAERLGVNPSTVQRISRPFDGASVAVA